MGMFQADGIKYMTFEGNSYILTANEGDTKDYTVEDLGLDEDWTESLRGEDFQNGRHPKQNVLRY